MLTTHQKTRTATAFAGNEDNTVTTTNTTTINAVTTRTVRGLIITISTPTTGGQKWGGHIGIGAPLQPPHPPHT